MQLWSVKIKLFQLVWTNTDIQAVLVLVFGFMIILGIIQKCNGILMPLILYCIAFLQGYVNAYTYVHVHAVLYGIVPGFSYFDCNLLFESL